MKAQRYNMSLPELSGLEMRQVAFVIEYCKDWDARRAAMVAGYPNPDTGYKLLQFPEVRNAIDFQIKRRMEESDITAEWLLYEAVDNHHLARAKGDLKSSNTALALIGKITLVDAFAAEKLEIVGDKEIAERLARGRKRNAKKDEPSFL